VVARAQQAKGTRRIGVLMSYPSDDPQGVADIAALRQGLADRGWIEGRTIDIVVRWPAPNTELIEAMAKELVESKPDVLLSRSTLTTAALQRESRTIPIVFVSVVEPIEQGFVQSLRRPGGNITGITNFEVSVPGKMVQLLKQIDPRIVRVLAIYNPQTAPFAGLYISPLKSAASILGIEIADMPVQSDSEIESAMKKFALQSGCGLVVIPDSFTFVHRDLVIALAARTRIPAIYFAPGFTQSGGLIMYAVDLRDEMYRSADYIDHILRGAKPADLPVQLPTRFQLAINMKTAKALGLEIPASILAIADEVIQ
jgi:putative ABC transport system substrate-binding protein